MTFAAARTVEDSGDGVQRWRQRQLLIKGLKDLVVHCDYSVRNSSGEVVQFEYGSDCIDPINVEVEELYIDFEYAWNHVLMIKEEDEEKDFEVQSEERKPFLCGQELRRRLGVICAELDFWVISSSSRRTTFATHCREKIEAFFAPVATHLAALFGRYNKAADDCDCQKICRITPSPLTRRSFCCWWRASSPTRRLTRARRSGPSVRS